jgi:hypothetical protein
MRVQHGGACVGVAQTGLTYSHRHTLLIHHRLVAVPESVEPATRNPQPLKQRVQFSFAHYVGIPWRTVFRREEKTELIRSPPEDVLPPVLDQLRRDFAEPVSPLETLPSESSRAIRFV